MLPTAWTPMHVSVPWNPGPEHVFIGYTIDWSTVAPVAAAYTIPAEQLTVPAGASYLRYGQVMCQIAASGLYGPYDPTAADGRAALVNGRCLILNCTVFADGLLGMRAGLGLGDRVVRHPRCAGLVGGSVRMDRIIHSGAGPHSLAAGPTLAALFGAMPRLAPIFGV